MASKDDATNSGGCTIQWKIEKIYNTWWMNSDQEIKSPVFTVDALHGTKWSLWLCLEDRLDEAFVGIYLHRENDCGGEEIIDINYEIAILDKNGLFLKVDNFSDNFLKSGTWGYTKFAPRKEVFLSKRESFLPEETLTVQCTMWNTERKPFDLKHLYARTSFREEARYFVWQIDNFSAVESGLRKNFRNNVFHFNLILNGNLNKTLCIDFLSCHDNIKYISIDTSIIDSTEGKKFGIDQGYFADELKKDLFTVFTFPWKTALLEDECLSNDVLTLKIGFIYYSIENFSSNDEFGNLTNKDGVLDDGKERTENTVALIDDLKSMFCDAILSDTELRTSTKSFPAHKNILSARSPVFKKMFGCDMKEKNTGLVDITDLEDDTVHRMLLYVYTDALGDLQFETALKLYAAADKYEILSLRNKCSTFLKDGLCPNRACDVLILSDLHHDDDLKSAVQSFILEHDEVFSLSEWKHLMDNNLKLAADIMYRKIKPGNSYPCNG